MTSAALPPSFRPRNVENTSVKQPSFPKSFQPKQEKQPNQEHENDTEREIERNQAQITSRMLERLFGTPGNIFQSLPQGVKNLIPASPLFEKLPTEKQLREKSEKLSRGYTKPRTQFEERVGDIAADVASFSVGGGSKTILGNTARVLGIPLAGEFAKEGIKRVGGSEKSQANAKLGTMLLLDLWGLKKGVMQGGAKQWGFNRLEDAEKAIPKNSMANVQHLESKLKALESNFKGGITGPHTSEPLRAIEETLGHIKNGQMPAEKFPRLRKDINKLIENMKGFTLGGPPRQIKKAALKNLNDVKSAIIDAGNKWGKQHAPEFYKNWSEGNEALAVFSKSREIGRFLSKHTKVKNPAVKMLFGMHAFKHPVAGAALAAGKKAAEKTTEFSLGLAYRFFKSKVLRDLYTDVVKEAAKGNAGAVASLSRKLDKEAEKEDMR